MIPKIDTPAWWNLVTRRLRKLCGRRNVEVARPGVYYLGREKPRFACYGVRIYGSLNLAFRGYRWRSRYYCFWPAPEIPEAAANATYLEYLKWEAWS